MILSYVREQLYDAVVPNLNSEDNIVLFNKYLNLVCERFINSGKFLGTTKEIALTATDNFITLPPRFKSCLAVKYADADNNGISPEIRNQWFRYLPGGSYLWSPATWASIGYSTHLTDLGDGFCTFIDSPYSTYYLKFTREDADDNGLKILVHGNDANNDAIYTEEDNASFKGIVTTLSAASVTTSQVFKGALQFLQKQPSKGYIKLEAVDVATAATTVIGRYIPSETVANYKRYATGGTAGTITTVNAICKLRFLPCVADSDEVIPSNLGALLNGLSAIKYEKEGDKQSYQQWFSDGLQLLNDEVKESRGGATFTINIDPSTFQFNKLYPGR